MGSTAEVSTTYGRIGAHRHEQRPQGTTQRKGSDKATAVRCAGPRLNLQFCFGLLRKRHTFGLAAFLVLRKVTTRPCDCRASRFRPYAAISGQESHAIPSSYMYENDTQYTCHAPGTSLCTYARRRLLGDSRIGSTRLWYAEPF